MDFINLKTHQKSSRLITIDEMAHGKISKEKKISINDREN